MVTDQRTRLPAVDESLVVPEQGYEVIDGQVLAVSPAEEPHATRHTKLAALLQAHVAEGWRVAVDMLTRTGQLDEFAPDASVYPSARDPVTGGRQLERLAFEIVATERLAHAGLKAAKLVHRGVYRVLAIDVERSRALEWSSTTESWELLASDDAIDDVSFVIPLPIAELVSAAASDDAVARALIAKHNRVIVDALADRFAEGEARGLAEGEARGRAEGEARGLAGAIVAVLAARGVALGDDERERIFATRDATTLSRWLDAAATCSSASALFGRDGG